MTKRDLELIVLGAVLARPELLEYVADSPLFAEMRNRRGHLLARTLGRIKLEPGKTLDNVLAEWKNLVDAEREVAECAMRLFEAKSSRWKFEEDYSILGAEK